VSLPFPPAFFLIGDETEFLTIWLSPPPCAPLSLIVLFFVFFFLFPPSSSLARPSPAVFPRLETGFSRFVNFLLLFDYLWILSVAFVPGDPTPSLFHTSQITLFRILFCFVLTEFFLVPL